MSNVTVRPELDEIINRLGRYFGSISKSAFLNYAAKKREKDGKIEPLSGIETAITTLGDVILDMQEGGKMTKDIIQQVNEKLNRTSPEDSENSLDTTMPSVLRITYEPIPDAAACNIVHGHTAGAKLKDQGSFAGSTDSNIFSIRKVLGKLDESNFININPEAPDKDTSPGLSVIQMIPPALTPANRDTGAISLLMNTIPTLEMSRAVPYIDIVAISRTPSLTEASNGAGRIAQMSLGQFLLGNDNVTGVSKVIAGALDQSVVKDPPPPLDNNDGTSSRASTVKDFGTAGMELFTSPQTLVNADEMHNEFDSIENSNFNTLTGEKETETLHPGGKRAAPVIDRFRPLMSLSDFKVNVSPLKGVMSYKSAEMNLILHDRSRLAEIAPFVKPDVFDRNHFLIEYGWAHPENKVHEFSPLGQSMNIKQLDDDLNANLIGLFISHMRCREKYHVINSSFTFDETGQVQINVKLAMLGGEDRFLTRIGSGGEVEEQSKAIKKVTEAIAEVRKKIGSSQAGGSEDVLGDSNILNIASTAESAVNLKKDDMKKINEFLKKNKGQSQVQEIEKLKECFTQLLGPNGDGTGTSLIASIRGSIAAEINRKMSAIKNGYDPWIRTMSLGGKDITEKNIGNYVSLGKIFTIFLGMPLADTKKFDDVQIYFYSFNDKASFAKDLNIAQFPIPCDDLEEMLKETMKLEANLPLMSFINFINNAFICDQGSPAYGMTNIFTDRDKESKLKRKLAKEFEEDGTLMFGEKQRILRSAYGEGADLVFKLPALKIKVETVPVADKTKDSDGVDEMGASKTILRVHVFDAQASSYTCLSSLLAASRRDQMGIITKSAGNVTNASTASPQHNDEFNKYLAEAVSRGLLELIPATSEKISPEMKSTEEASKGKRYYRLAGGFPALKNYISRAMPSVAYGSQNSGIIKANVQSMQNALLSTVNMQRQGLRPGDQPQSKRDAGVPMTVQPVECSLETIGCPLWEFGQQIFIDFGTGTSVDNVYQVIGLDHSLKAGEFRTTVKLASLLTWGVYESMVDKIMEATAVIASAPAANPPDDPTAKN